MNFRRIFRLAVCAISAVVLAGCATSEEVNQLKSDLAKQRGMIRSLDGWSQTHYSRIKSLQSEFDSLDWQLSKLEKKERNDTDYGIFALQQYQSLQLDSYVSQFYRETKVSELEGLVLETKKELLEIISALEFESNNSNVALVNEIANVDKRLVSLREKEAQRYDELLTKIREQDGVVKVEVKAQAEEGHAFAAKQLYIQLAAGENPDEFVNRWQPALRALEVGVDVNVAR